MEPSLRTAVEIVHLALALWREVRGESRACKVAVAYSVLTRVRKGGWWGTDVLAVLSKPLQYSSFTHPADSQLTRWPQIDDPAYAECLDVARGCVAGIEPDVFPDADSYHDVSIPPPRWASPDCYVGQSGRVKFYNVRPAKPGKEIG